MATTQVAVRAMQLAAVVTMGGMYMWGVVEATPNRVADGYLNSGYMWPKTLVRKGLRSSPGSIWFFYNNSVISGACLLLEALDWQLQRNPMSKLQETISSLGAFAVAAGLLYVTASVTQLSDVVEAYLAGMVTVQLLIPGLLLQTGSKVPRLLLLSGLQMAAVLGTAMLDSYRPLNLLNLVYSVVGTLLLAAVVFTDVCTVNIACFVQMGFSIAAFVVADNVQGSHRGPMLWVLITACLYTLLTSLVIIMRHRDDDE